MKEALLTQTVETSTLLPDVLLLRWHRLFIIINFLIMAQEVIHMTPESSLGYRALGWHNWYLAGVGKSPRESIGKAFKLAQKALSLDESDS